MPALTTALQLALPVVLTAGGVVAIVAVPDAVPAPPRQVWIDSPADGARLEPGAVGVVAHAADGTRLTSMSLEVDGQVVDTESGLTRFDRLAGVEFTWEATEGQHFLVVTGQGLRSATVAVDVGETVLGTPDATVAPTASATQSASGSPTPTESASASESATTGLPSPTSNPTQQPTQQPTQSGTPGPTPTETSPPPPPDPVLGPVSVNPSDVYAGLCQSQIVVRADATDATGGSAIVTGPGVDKNVGGGVVDGVFTVSFTQFSLAGKNLSGPFRVEVTVTNDTGFDVGAADFQISCAKD